MHIRQLIDILEQYEHDSDQGENTRISINLNVHELNGSGFYIRLPIDDISITFDEKDSVEIEATVSHEHIQTLQEMNDKLNALYIKHPYLSPQYIEEE